MFRSCRRSCLGRAAVRPSAGMVRSYEDSASRRTGDSTKQPTGSNDTGSPARPLGTGAPAAGSVCRGSVTGRPGFLRGEAAVPVPETPRCPSRERRRVSARSPRCGQAGGARTGTAAGARSRDGVHAVRARPPAPGAVECGGARAPHHPHARDRTTRTTRRRHARPQTPHHRRPRTTADSGYARRLRVPPQIPYDRGLGTTVPAAAVRPGPGRPVRTGPFAPREPAHHPPHRDPYDPHDPYDPYDPHDLYDLHDPDDRHNRYDRHDPGKTHT